MHLTGANERQSHTAHKLLHIITSDYSIRCSILLPRFSVEPDHTCLAILS